jgi:Gpi18-like mannosyltransferase
VLGLIFFSFAIFFILTLPTRPLLYNAGEVAAKRLINYEAIYGAETGPDGKKYAWTRPAAQFFFVDAPRYAPLLLRLELKLARPEGAAPAFIQVGENLNGNFVPITTITPEAGTSGYQTYQITIPPAAQLDQGLVLEINANSFRVAGDTRALGVILADYSLEMQPNHLRWMLWPRPFLLAFGLLLLGICLWGGRAGLKWLEMALLLAPISVLAGLYCNFLIGNSWWLCLLGGLVILSSLWDKLPAIKRWGGLPALIFASAAFSLFFLTQVPGIGDLELFQFWISDLEKYGVWRIYQNSSFFNYPPLFAHVFWLYAQITGWFGQDKSIIVLQAFFGLALPVGVGLIGRFGRNSSNLSAPVVTAFSAALLFDSIIWGQADTMTCVFMLAAFLLLFNQRPYLSGGVMGLAVLFKQNAWLILPYFCLLFLRKFGWQKTWRAGAVSVLLVIALSLPVFGFSGESLNLFFNQPRMTGELTRGTYGAYNLFFLLGYEGDSVPSNVLIWAGVALVGAVYLLCVWAIYKGKVEAGEAGFAAGLITIVTFLFAVRMHERFMLYALIWLALAAITYPRLYKPLLGLGLISLINMAVGFKATPRRLVPDTFYFWADLLKPDIAPRVLAIVTMLLFGYLCYMFWREVRQKI